MLIAPLIALLLTLATTTSHAQCPPNSWNYQPNVIGSDLDPSDFDWLKTRAYSKQKFGMDLTSITSKSSMEVFKSAARTILSVDSLSEYPRPFSWEISNLLINLSTEDGYKLLIDKERFKRLGPIAYCRNNFKLITDEIFQIDTYYRIEGLRYNSRPGSPINTRRLIFIKKDGKWLFDRLGDNSDLPKFI